MKIKTIDVNAKEWFDKVNGNSYFSTNVTINYGMKNQTGFKIPMEYGYGDHYRDVAFKELIKRGFIKNVNGSSHWQYYLDHNIIARHNKQENCLKRDLNR